MTDDHPLTDAKNSSCPSSHTRIAWKSIPVIAYCVTTFSSPPCRSVRSPTRSIDAAPSGSSGSR
jgi:hypothetical protein